jgi:hypothetical protein
MAPMKNNTVVSDIFGNLLFSDFMVDYTPLLLRIIDGVSVKPVGPVRIKRLGFRAAKARHVLLYVKAELRLQVRQMLVANREAGEQFGFKRDLL